MSLSTVNFPRPQVPPPTGPFPPQRGIRAGAGHPIVELPGADRGEFDLAAHRPAPDADQGGWGAETFRSALTPQAAFDALYGYAAPGLIHQTFLLTGLRRRAFESVEYAFHHAWEHWPDVAVDPDPVGWVRSHTHEYALSPWHRFRRAPWQRHEPAPANPLCRALLDLTPRHRRTLLLCDGLGLTLSQTAAETAASTGAVRGRLLHARAVIGGRLPELDDPDVLLMRLGTLVTESSTATLPTASSVRRGSERRTHALTRAAFGATAALVALVTYTAATTPTHSKPTIPHSHAADRAAAHRDGPSLSQQPSPRPVAPR